MTITIRPKSKKDLIKIKKILDAVEIDFEESNEMYDEEFVKKIQKSKEEIQNGETVKIAIEALWR